MIGLDTNVLVRFLAGDDAVQSAIATQLITSRLSVEEPGYVSAVVMAETAWVLERALGWRGPELASILESILSADTLLVEHEHEVSEAVLALKRGRASFADALISALARQAGCSHTVTFDRRASRLPDFELI